MTEDNRDHSPEEPARPSTGPAQSSHETTPGTSGAAERPADPPAGSTPWHDPAGQAAPGIQPTTPYQPPAAPPAPPASPLVDNPWSGSGSSAPPASPPSSPYQRSPYAGPPAEAPTASSAPLTDRPAAEQEGSTPFTADSGASADTTPAAAFGSGGGTPPQAYSPPGERVLFGTAVNQGAGLGTPPQSGSYPQVTAPIPAGPNQPPRIPEQRRGAPGLFAALTVLALLVGGGAGAVGGYLVAENDQSSAPTTYAPDQPPPADRTSTPAPAGSVEAVAEKVVPSVVQLQVQGGGSAGEGSGFVISSDGLIVTNNHVVEAAADGGRINVVFQDGSNASAEIVGRDPTSDVAVVRADKTGLPVVELGRSDDLRVGESVVAIGSPFELSGTVTSGIVSSLHRPTRAGGEDGSQATVMDAIQTDAAINPGNSGGPLVNMQGQVIGINSAIYSPTQSGSIGIGFAIPIDQARRTADEIVKTGKATQTILGVTVSDGNDGGAEIVDVTANGPGAKAGLKRGDVVTKLDDRRIDTSDALVAAVRSHKPGDKVRLELSNGSRTVDATLAGQPVETE
jgi:putative serine protease PepD